MKLFNKNFYFGCFTGMVLTVAGSVAASLAFVEWSRESLRDRIEAPPLPMAQDGDYDWTAQTLEGADFHFSALKGKAVFLTFWSPTCELCIAELPFIQSLYEETESDGIEIAMVSVQKSARIVELIDEYNLTFPIYVLEGERPEAYDTGTVPSTFILAPDGKIAYRKRGPARWDDESSLGFLRRLAATPASPAGEH